VDAASLAALAALMSFQYPVVTVSEEEEDKGRVIIHPPEARHAAPATPAAPAAPPWGFHC